MADTRIVIPIYPGITHLDFTGPHQIFARIPDCEVIVGSLGGRDIVADGLTFSALADLEVISGCDVLCVPGGLGTSEAMLDQAFMDQIGRLGAGAAYLTSVCTGSLILGAAGFLKGRRAATHWASRTLLPYFGATISKRRVERDGNLITGGGVTAGIDFALALAAELRGQAVAEGIQLALEYAPDPPFMAGQPSGETLVRTERAMADSSNARVRAAQMAAARLEAATA
ncbi:MAG: DJ-1/PfpI family protein [Hyphomicrobiales bacterium]|nr:MAG: DJ-1/PfpI family protein [Hyphomicrobiales bacterium]